MQPFEDLPYETLPAQVQGGIKAYVMNKRAPGHFLSSVLKNDLLGAFSYADLSNRQDLHLIVKWLYNEAPSTCWGSKEAFDKWVTQPEKDNGTK